jgi:hypothetical protein
MTAEQLARLLELIDAGLVDGIGEPRAGATCFEGAVTMVLGEAFSDSPSCVAPVDRDFMIALNDAPWSSPAARAAGMRSLVAPHLDTARLDRSAWYAHLLDGMIRRVLPLALRAAASAQRDDGEDVGDAVDAGAVAAADAAHAAALREDHRALAASAAARAAAKAAIDEDAHAIAGHAAHAAAASEENVDEILRVAVDVALVAYRAEGRAQTADRR